MPFPEDHADETINRIAKRVSEKEEIRNPAGYYLGVARMLLLEINRERIREQQALTDMPITLFESESSEDFDERIESLRSCLRHLSDESRQLILQYYHGEKREKIESRRRLSERLGFRSTLSGCERCGSGKSFSAVLRIIMNSVER